MGRYLLYGASYIKGAGSNAESSSSSGGTYGDAPEDGSFPNFRL